MAAVLEGGSTKRMGTPGGVWICLQGCKVNELRLYRKMLNLFSGFPHHEQDPRALEPEGQLLHSFPEVSLLRKKEDRLFVALTL